MYLSRLRLMGLHGPAASFGHSHALPTVNVLFCFLASPGPALANAHYYTAELQFLPHGIFNPVGLTPLHFRVFACRPLPACGLCSTSEYSLKSHRNQERNEIETSKN